MWISCSSVTPGLNIICTVLWRSTHFHIDVIRSRHFPQPGALTHFTAVIHLFISPGHLEVTVVDSLWEVRVNVLYHYIKIPKIFFLCMVVLVCIGNPFFQQSPLLDAKQTGVYCLAYLVSRLHFTTTISVLSTNAEYVDSACGHVNILRCVNATHSICLSRFYLKFIGTLPRCLIWGQVDLSIIDIKFIVWQIK